MVSLSALLARLALALVAVGLIPATARAETFAVNTPDDGTTCTVIACSLRGAIAAANANGAAEADAITVPAGQYVLSSQFPALNIASGQQVEIRGAGANVTSITPQAGFNVRLLLVNSNATVGLSDLTLRGGTVTSGAGGNLLVSGAAVTLTRTRIVGGQAPTGGGVAITAGSATSSLTIRQSLLDGNTATGTTSAAAGGGLYVEGQTFPAAVTVTDSTFFGNSAATAGRSR